MQAQTMSQQQTNGQKPSLILLITFFILIVLFNVVGIYGGMRILREATPDSQVAIRYRENIIINGLGAVSAAIAAWGISRYKNWGRVLGIIVAVLFLGTCAIWMSNLWGVLKVVPISELLLSFWISLGTFVAGSIGGILTLFTLFRYKYRQAFGAVQPRREGEKVYYQSSNIFVTEKRLSIRPNEWPVKQLRAVSVTPAQGKYLINLFDQTGKQLFLIELEDQNQANEVATAINKAVG